MINNKLECALLLAELGFYIHPLKPNSKIPAKNGWQDLATRDPKFLWEWWAENPEYNIGISTSKFAQDESLVVVDVDVSNGKPGEESILKLKSEGLELTNTFIVSTASGGKHYIYRTKKAVKQGVSVLGPGVDIRSSGGNLVGAGSTINGVKYRSKSPIEIHEAPEWLIKKLGVAPEKKEKEVTEIEGVNQDRAIKLAIQYLNQAPVSIEGASGDQTAYSVACAVKDFGVNMWDCLTLLTSNWNSRCLPPWSLDELKIKVENAYRYGQEPVGVKSVEAEFKDEVPVEEKELHPFEKLNKEFAFCIDGGNSSILWETVDARGYFSLKRLTIQAFHEKFASQTMTVQEGKGTVAKSVTRLWMTDPKRRSYDGFCFSPGKEVASNYYNLWRGFSVEPLKPGEEVTGQMKNSLKMFLDHAKENVSDNDESLFNWLIGYFAHLIQKPWEKPLVALVFKGLKGVGKNALIERVGHLIGSNFAVVSDKRYLTSNFNGHLENNLMFALDEAFWSGDKSTEGVLKGLVTSKHHMIERKGKEPYQAVNYTRVVVIGNEDWLVPATHDERRYAVFNVGEGKKQDQKFFEDMRVGMEAGGYKLLLKYLSEFDLKTVNVNKAPMTKGLHEQKIASLQPMEQWWYESLIEGRLLGFGNTNWLTEIKMEDFRMAFRNYFDSRKISSRFPSNIVIGKELRRFLNHQNPNHKKRDAKESYWHYKIPELAQARECWDAIMKYKHDWDQA